MTILITGAGDGLGLALARIYEAEGRPVIALGRRPFTELDSPPYPSSRYIQIDLARPDADTILLRALNALEIPSLDLVIHNAGIGYFGPPERQTERDIQDLIGLNFTLPIRLTLALMSRLEAAKGNVVFIGSVAAALPCPQYVTYAASKRGLEGFARSLRLEAEGRFKVQVVHPGPMRTRFHEKAGIPLDEMKWDAFPDVARTAGEVVRAIQSRKAVATLGAGNRTIGRLARQFPQMFDLAWGRRFR